MLESLIKGFIVGIGVSVPLGPLGVLCVQKTLGKGRNSGLITGMGAAISDTVFAAIAVMGLAYIQNLVNSYESFVLMIGGLIVALIGVKVFFTNPIKQIRRPKGSSKKHLTDFFSAVAMTITNPGSVFLILGMFAFVGLEINAESAGRIISATLGGVFLGASFWWYILSTSINVFRNKFRLRQLFMINRVSGIVIIALGLISFFDGLWHVISPYLFSLI